MTTDPKTGALSLLSAAASWVFERVLPQDAEDADEPIAPAAADAQEAPSRYEEHLAWALDRWLAVVDRLPGAGTAERVLLRTLKRRLADVDRDRGRESRERPSSERVPGFVASRDGAEAQVAPPPTLGEMLNERIERALEQTPVESRTAFFTQLLQRLTPDEARIISTLSDGSAFPLIHLGYGSAFGGEMTRVLENLSTIGRPAGVMALDLVPRYVGNLRALGLVETGPEDTTLQIGYEILEAEVEVRRQIDQMHANRQRPRIVRRSLRLAPLGAELWSACQQSYDEPT